MQPTVQQGAAPIPDGDKLAAVLAAAAPQDTIDYICQLQVQTNLGVDFPSQIIA